MHCASVVSKRAMHTAKLAIMMHLDMLVKCLMTCQAATPTVVPKHMICCFLCQSPSPLVSPVKAHVQQCSARLCKELGVLSVHPCACKLQYNVPHGPPQAAAEDV